MGFLELILGGIARPSGTASRAAVNEESAGGGINGGEPALRGEPAVYAAKAGGLAIDGCVEVVG